MQELDRHYGGGNHFEVLDQDHFRNGMSVDSDDDHYEEQVEQQNVRRLMSIVDRMDEEVKQEQHSRHERFLGRIIPMSGYDSGEEIRQQQRKQDRFLKRTRGLFEMECDEGEESDESQEGMFRQSKRRRIV